MLIGKEIEGDGEAAADTLTAPRTSIADSFSLRLSVFCCIMKRVTESLQEILMFRAGLCLSFQLIPVVPSSCVTWALVRLPCFGNRCDPRWMQPY